MITDFDSDCYHGLLAFDHFTLFPSVILLDTEVVGRARSSRGFQLPNFFTGHARMTSALGLGPQKVDVVREVA